MPDNNNRVRSLPDGLSHVLEDYLRQRSERILTRQNHSEPAEAESESGGSTLEYTNLTLTPPPAREQPLLKIGDLCPECGMAAVINEEGCRKCYACGYSEC